MRHRKYRFIAWSAIIAQVGLFQSINASSPAHKILELERPLVIAHRGYTAAAPENTIPAFELSKLAGADLVELDYHMSRDGVAVVIHDFTLDRTTSAIAEWGIEKINIYDKSAKEMEHLDAGGWFHKRYEGTKMPTLEEALAAIQADGGICLVERKAGGAEHIVELLERLDLVNKVIVQSFDWEFIREVHALQPEQVLGAIGPQKTWEGRKLETEEKELTPRWVDEALATGANLVVWNAQVNKESVDYVHSKGAKLLVYTINDLEPAQQLFEAGVDGIITNNTGLIWKALALSK